jgi:hypothetical protein
MRLIRSAAVAIATPLLATACSLGSASSTPPGATSPASANPDAGLLTGTQLNAMLAPASWFPAGYTADPTGTRNTGSSYEPPTASGSLPCSRLDATAWIDLARIGPVSFAQNDYIDNDTSEEYAQEIDVFQGSGAQQAMTALRNLASTCPSFKDTQTSSTVTVQLRSGPALGDDGLTLLLSDPAWQAGTALEAVRVGSAVITVLYSGASGTGVAQATTLASLLATNVKSKIKS